MHSQANTRTRERILDGAVDAIARHGLGKLGIGDISESSSISRATIYRYFNNRDEILAVLAQREGQRIQEELLRALEEAQEWAEQLHLAIQFAARHAREHPVLNRLVETDPALVLRSLRRELPAIKEMLGTALHPLLANTELVRSGVATADQLLDWLTRLMISAFLFPDANSEQMAQDLTSVYRVITVRPAPSADRSKRNRSNAAAKRGGRSAGKRRPSRPDAAARNKENVR